ncbi:MAG TPA: PAS domain-containing sensor histidine kinase, partial [Methanocella sp.]|nr:PAS domain-containing sensor histidine kinase [Methanocella sp.]
AMVVIDKNGVIQYANPAALALFGLPRSELIGRLLGSPIVRREPVDMAVVREFREVAAAEMRVAEVEWAGKPSYLISFRDVSRHVLLEEELRRARDELEARVQERTAELSDAIEKQREEIETRKTIEEELRVEVEERTTAEEELRAEIEQKEAIEKDLEEARNQAEFYLDLMAHDIRNLNQISLGYLELAQETTDADELKSLIAKPLEALNSASRIIDNVKKLKSLPAREASEPLKAVNLCDMLAELKGQYTNVYNRKVTISLATPPICFVYANDLIVDAFANLIDNAIKHADPERPLAIDVSVTPIVEDGKSYYLCSVADNGPGIRDFIKDKIFDRFQRGETKAHGRGLGLYLVKRLIENYRGSIWVEDRAPGDASQGAKFVVMLRAAD